MIAGSNDNRAQAVQAANSSRPIGKLHGMVETDPMDLWISRNPTQIGWGKAARKPMNSWDVYHQLVQDFATVGGCFQGTGCWNSFSTRWCPIAS